MRLGVLAIAPAALVAVATAAGNSLDMSDLAGLLNKPKADGSGAGGAGSVGHDPLDSQVVVTMRPPTSTPPSQDTPAPSTTAVHVLPFTPKSSPAPAPAPRPAASPVPRPAPSPSPAGVIDDTSKPTAPPLPEPPESPSPVPVSIPLATPYDVPTQSPPAASPTVPPASLEDPVSPSPPGPVGEDPPTTTVTSKSPPLTGETRDPSDSKKTASPNATPGANNNGGIQNSNTPAATIEYTVGSTGSTTAPPEAKRYRRGDNVLVVKKELGNGTVVDVEVVVSGPNVPAVLEHDTSTRNSASNGAQAQATSPWVTITATVMSVLAALTFLFLFVFHFVASEASGTAFMSSFIRPNQWELLAFVTYIQSMASAAYYVVTAVPSSLWDFVDAFSWIVCIPFHHSSNGVVATNSSGERKLSDVMVLDGLVAFADRIGVNETVLLQTSVVGVTVVSGILLLVALAVVLRVKHHHEQTQQTADPFGFGVLPRTLATIDAVHPPPANTACRAWSMIRGVAVVLAVFALFPVTLLSTFELASQLRAGDVAVGSLVVALLALAVVPVLLVASSLSSLCSVDSEEEFTTDSTYRTVWGVLASSAVVRFDRRLHFVGAWLALQLLSAVVVGSVLSASWQLVLLLGIDVVFVVFVLVARPFTDDDQSALVATVAVGVLRILNTSLAWAFVHERSSHRDDTVAVVFIVINTIVITAWFVRQLVTAVPLLKTHYRTHHSSRKSATAASLQASTNASSSPSQASQSPSDAQYQSALYVDVSSTRAGRRGTAVL